jgi:hypothetical protein
LFAIYSCENPEHDTMDAVIKHLEQMIDVGPGAWTLILIICGSAMWIVREHLSNIAMTVLCMPVMISLSLIVNYAIVLGSVYQQNKLAEWLIWTIVAGTVGALGGVGMMAIAAKLADRQPAEG